MDRCKKYFNGSFLLPFPCVLLPISFTSPANLPQRLLGFMRPDGASSQQVQQELQRKYHSELPVQVLTFFSVFSKDLFIFRT